MNHQPLPSLDPQAAEPTVLEKNSGLNINSGSEKALSSAISEPLEHPSHKVKLTSTGIPYTRMLNHEHVRTTPILVGHDRCNGTLHPLRLCIGNYCRDQVAPYNLANKSARMFRPEDLVQRCAEPHCTAWLHDECYQRNLKAEGWVKCGSDGIIYPEEAGKYPDWFVFGEWEPCDCGECGDEHLVCESVPPGKTSEFGPGCCWICGENMHYQVKSKL